MVLPGRTAAAGVLLLGGVLGAVHLVLGLPGASGRGARSLHVEGRVLTGADGRPVVPPADLAAALRRAAEVLKEQAGVELVPFPPPVLVLPDPPPPGALRPGCGLPALLDALGAAGAFYRRHEVRGRRRLRRGAPLTVYAVDQVAPGRRKAGCSLGPFADHVVVGRSGLRRPAGLTVAHEIGHACGLPHLGSAGTLMQPSPRGRHPVLRPWQRVLLRASRHVARPADVVAAV